MNSVKKRIEKKQNRLNRLVLQGSITQAKANEQILQYARLVYKILEG